MRNIYVVDKIAGGVVVNVFELRSDGEEYVITYGSMIRTAKLEEFKANPDYKVIMSCEANNGNTAKRN